MKENKSNDLNLDGQSSANYQEDGISCQEDSVSYQEDSVSCQEDSVSCQEDSVNQANDQKNFKTPTTVGYWDYYHNDIAAGQTQKTSYLITNAKKPTINASRTQEKNKNQDDMAKKITRNEIKNSLFDNSNLENVDDYSSGELADLQDAENGVKNITNDFRQINLKQQDEFFSSQSEKYKKHQKKYNKMIENIFQKRQEERKQSIPETLNKLVKNKKKKPKKILNKQIDKKGGKITNLMQNIKQKKVKKKQNLRKKERFFFPIDNRQINMYIIKEIMTKVKPNKAKHNAKKQENAKKKELLINKPRKNFVIPVDKNQYNGTKQILNRVENNGKYEQFCKNNYR